jgi:hypothetical protein
MTTDSKNPNENVLETDRFRAERVNENLMTVTRKKNNKLMPGGVNFYIFSTAEVKELQSIKPKIDYVKPHNNYSIMGKMVRGVKACWNLISIFRV